MNKNCPSTIKHLLSSLFILSVFLTLQAPIAYAQTSDISYSYSVPIESEGKIENGTIISLKNGLYISAKKENDPDIIGIVSQGSAIQFELASQKPTYPLITRGHSTIKVSPINGDIKVGDFITSSSIPGIGVKSVKNGMVIGQALQNYTFQTTDEIAEITVSINIHTNATVAGGASERPLTNLLYTSLSDIFHLPSSSIQPAPPFFRYTLASLIIITSIIFSYKTFLKVTRLGVEAIGRNPLAKRSIMTGVIFNAGIASIIIFAGVVVTYYIVRI